MEINLQGVYGAGPDGAFGGGMRWLGDQVKSVMGSSVYVAPLLDYDTRGDYEKLVARLRKWRDPIVLYAHSCGCMVITRAAKEAGVEIRYLMAIAPSVFCPVEPLRPNVIRATQGSSWALDAFNLGSRQLLSVASGNKITKLDVIKTGMGYKKPVNKKEVKLKHVPASYSPLLRDRLVAECRDALRYAK
jgi:hypothetical protein